MQEGPTNDGLLFIQIASVANTSNLPLKDITLSLFLRRAKQVGNNRIPIASKQCSLVQERCSVGEMGMAVCQREDFLEVEMQDNISKTNAYLKLPLEKLLEIPKVRHDVECLLVEKNWDRFFEGPLRNIVEVGLSIIAFTQITAKLVISALEVDMGSGSRFLELQLQGEKDRLESKQGQQRRWFFQETVSFSVGDFNKSLQLVVSALNESNEVVGRQEIDLIAENMLLPQEAPEERTFTLLTESKRNSGTIRLQYQVIVTN